MNEVTYRKKGKPLSIAEKWLVVHVYCQCEKEWQEAYNIETKNMYSRTARYTGIGRRQVVEIISHYKKTGDVPALALAGNRLVHQTNIPQVVEKNIREYIFKKHINGEICTANNIKDLLNEILETNFPRSTICAHLNRMGFSYKRTHRKTRSLRESQHIRQQRHSYINDIRNLRKSGYTPVYLDESFLHHYHGHEFSWFSANDYLERPTGRGRRWCFIHAMMKNGLIPNAFLIFEAKKSSGDYHDMFNAKHFQEWWNGKLLPNLPEKCVIIVDRAPYHCVPEEQIIPNSMKKGEIKNWLTSRNIPWEEEWLKPKLIETVESHIDNTPIVQKIAENSGHKFLLLPTHHPELNPIETVWGIVKNECGRLLRNGVKFSDVRKHLENAIANITATACAGLYEKIIKQEDEYWVMDIMMDEIEY